MKLERTFKIKSAADRIYVCEMVDEFGSWWMSKGNTITVRTEEAAEFVIDVCEQEQIAFEEI